MRSIKFRAWNTDNKTMIIFNMENITTDPYRMAHFCDLVSGTHKDGVMMQSTGLTDKNGVDIYEGDIVKSHFYGSEAGFECIALVGYDDSQAKFTFNSGDGEQDAFVFGMENGQLEVIGNIHKNPELLK